MNILDLWHHYLDADRGQEGDRPKPGSGCWAHQDHRYVLCVIIIISLLVLSRFYRAIALLFVSHYFIWPSTSMSMIIVHTFLPWWVGAFILHLWCNFSPKKMIEEKARPPDEINNEAIIWIISNFIVSRVSGSLQKASLKPSPLIFAWTSSSIFWLIPVATHQAWDK